MSTRVSPRLPSPIQSKPVSLPASVKPPNEKAPNLQRGVLYSVGPNMNNPTSCSVLINNRYPARPGYTLPAGCGQFYHPGDRITINGVSQAAPGPFVTDPSTMEGGTWVLVDTANMIVVQFLQGTSNSIPSSAAMLVATHVHTGGQDANGNPMPSPIDLGSETTGSLPLTRVAANPSPDTPPVCSDSPLNTPTYPLVNKGSYDAEISFDLTQPSGFGNWLAEVRVYSVPMGTTVPAGRNPFATTPATHRATMPPNTGGAYTAIIGGLTSVNGQQYDLYAVYMDGQAVMSAATKISQPTSATPMQIGNNAQLPYPGGAASFLTVQPVVTVTSNPPAAISNENSTTFDVQMSFTLDANGYVNNSSSTSGWLAEIQLWAQALNSQGQPGNAGAFQAGVLAPSSANGSVYTGVWPSLGNGTQYNLFLRYVDYAGNYSALSPTITTASAGGLGSSALQKNPNPNVGPAYSVSPHYPAGATTHDNTFEYDGSGSGAYEAVTQFTLTVTNPTWLKDIRLYSLTNGNHVSSLSTNAKCAVKGSLAPNATGAYTAVFAGLSAGTSYDLYISYIDMSGGETPLTLVGTSTTNGLTIAPGQIPSFGGPNLIVASGFENANANGRNEPHWAFEWIDGLSFKIDSADISNDVINKLHIFSGDNSRHCQALSEAIPVQPGTQYVLSAYFYMRTGTGNLPYWAVVGTNWNLGTASGTLYSTKLTPQATNNQWLQVSLNWTCPAGVTQVCVLFDSNQYALTNSGSFSTGAPMLCAGASGPYRPGPLSRQAVAVAPPTTDGNSTLGGPTNTTDTVGTLYHGAHSAGVQSAIDSSGNQLNLEFTGGKEQADGSWTNVDSVSSATQYSLNNGQPFATQTDIAKGSTAFNAGIILGNTTNGYLILCDGGGKVYLAKYVSGVLTALTPTTASITNDTNYHSYRLTVVPTASGNIIEGSVDNVYLTAADSSLTL